MNTFLKIERAFAAVVLALCATALITYVASELHVHWYVSANGLSERAAISEDYGFAFENVLVVVVGALISFPITVLRIWRMLDRFGFGAKRE